MFFAEENAELWGMAGGWHEGEISHRITLVSMWVAPAHRRSGVGRMLVAAVQDWARTCGYHEMELWVTQSSVPAVTFYKSLGFTSTGCTQPLPSNPALSEELFQADLAG